jgi:ectoine hydroxylase-related dioxygenase (phytanoyl-CoA dioxygenase family)
MVSLMDILPKLSDLMEKGFCVLSTRYPASLIDACRDAFWPDLLDYLAKNGGNPNRGPYRHFIPMPFHSPCFTPEFFFDAEVLKIVRSAMGDRIVADQWGCDVPLRGSQNQQIHADYQNPLFAELPDLLLPPYILVVSFGLVRITDDNGPIQIAPGTHLMPREEGLRRVESGEIEMQPIPLEIGDVLIRHPWALHRGTPNLTDMPRALTTIRYVRRWYADDSREKKAIPKAVWASMKSEQKNLLRFSLEK